MLVKPFLATYVKVLSVFVVGTLAVISGLYFTSDSGSHNHKTGNTASAPHTPSSPAPAPTRTAYVFVHPQMQPTTAASPTHPGPVPSASPAAKPAPKPTPSTTPTSRPTTPAPQPTPSATTPDRGLDVTVHLGLDTTRSDTRTPLRTTSPRSFARSVLSASQYSCLSAVVERESGWNVFARNPYSGAYGLGQALPGSKMASYGADWRTNGVTQIKWVIHYMNSRYGSPCGAWSFWKSHRWY